MFRIIRVFNYFLLIFFITSQKCGPETPSNKNDCLETSNNNYKNICCFASVSSINKLSKETLGTKNICMLIPKDKTFIAPYLTEMDLGIQNENLKMNVDCGDTIQIDKTFPKCGPEDPKNFKECNDSSTSKSSCCYFRSPDGKATCLMNPDILKQNKTMYGIMITCSKEFVKLDSYKYVFFIIILIIM